MCMPSTLRETQLQALAGALEAANERLQRQGRARSLEAMIDLLPPLHRLRQLAPGRDPAERERLELRRERVRRLALEEEAHPLPALLALLDREVRDLACELRAQEAPALVG